MSANIEPPYQGGFRTKNSVVKQNLTSQAFEGIENDCLKRMQTLIAQNATQEAFPTRKIKKTNKKKLCPKSEHNKP